MKTKGSEFFDKKLFRESAQCFDHALDLIRDVPDQKDFQTKLISNLGICHLHMKEYRIGAQFFLEALVLDEKFIKARVNLVKCLAFDEKWLDAYDQINKIKHDHPQYFDQNFYNKISN